MSGLCRMLGLSRRAVHRWGTTLALIAMLGQIAVFTLHRPALALSPFEGDEHALCLSGGAGSSTPDHGRQAPLGDDLQCPICKTLQHAVAILPVVAALDVPVDFGTIELHSPSALTVPRISASTQPRAPPSALSWA